MPETLLASPHIFWLSLGGLLLAAEMLGGNGYLLWSGVASLVTGLLVWVVPLGWESQGALFAVLTLLAVWLWWRWLARRVSRQSNTGGSVLNQRGQQLVGQRFILDEPLLNGRGHLRIGDSSWPVRANDDLSAGTLVEVTAVEGITLHIKIYNN